LTDCQPVSQIYQAIHINNTSNHSLYPEKFADETYRVLQKNGIFILHVQLGIDQDKYTEVIIENKESVKKNFKQFKLIKEGPY
tara:strand:- start:87 stop:335 length:249 start_codon:yes stop_codon:yes gene_type:complete